EGGSRRLSRTKGGIDGERTGKAGDVDRELYALREVVHGALRDLRRVFLEAVWRVEEHRARRRAAEAGHGLAMGRHHGRRGLAGPHDHEDAGRGHRKKPSRAAVISTSATRSGNCE